VTETSKKNNSEYMYTNDDYTFTYDYNTVGGGTTTASPYTITTDSTTEWTFPNQQDSKIVKRLDAIEKRLRIIPELSDKDNKALKDAYDHYKFIEKLIEGEENELGKEPE